MKKFIAGLLISLLISIGLSTSDEPSVVQATSLSCQTSHTIGTYTWKGSCHKTDQAMNFEHRIEVWCTDGRIYTGAWRWTYQYSENWSTLTLGTGCVFKYQPFVRWRRI